MKDEGDEILIEVGDPEEAEDGEATIWVGETEYEERPRKKKEKAELEEPAYVDVGQRDTADEKEEKIYREKKREKRATKEKSEKREPTPGKEQGHRGRKKYGRMVGAIIAVVMLVVAGALIWIDIAPVDLVPVIEAPTIVTAGDLVEVSGTLSSGRIVNYSWDFGDGAIAYGEKQQHVYSRSDLRTISLTITDEKGRSAKETTNINVRPLVIVLPGERYDERVIYDAWNYLSIYNPNGIVKMDASGYGLDEEEVELRRVDLWMNGTTTNRLTEGGVREDGFLERMETVNRSSHHQLQVKGTLHTTSATGRIEGPLTVWDSSFSEMQDNSKIQTIVSSIGDFSVSFSSKDTDITMVDNLVAYPEPGVGDKQFSVEDLKDDRTFSLGENGLKNMGGVAYMWDIRIADRIGDHPSLVLDINIDQDTLDENGIEDFSLKIWISNASFMPLKAVLEMRQVSQGNETDVRTENVMTSILAGGAFVEYSTGEAEFLSTWAEKDARIADEFFSRMEIVPLHSINGTLEQNQDAVPSDFTIMHALDLALANDETGLRNYLNSNPGAYCTSSKYGKNSLVEHLSHEWWSMTFHSPGKAGLEVNVTFRRLSNDYKYESFGVEAREVYEESSISPVLSFQGAQLVFREHPSLYPKIFINNKIDVTKGHIGTEANISLPVATTLFSPPTVGYGYTVKHVSQLAGGFTETTQSVIDAETGRYLYVWVHKDNASGLMF